MRQVRKFTGLCLAPLLLFGCEEPQLNVDTMSQPTQYDLASEALDTDVCYELEQAGQSHDENYKELWQDPDDSSYMEATDVRSNFTVLDSTVQDGQRILTAGCEMESFFYYSMFEQYERYTRWETGTVTIEVIDNEFEVVDHHTQEPANTTFQ